jgi:hypothetical protein
MSQPELPASLAEKYHTSWFDYVDASGRGFVACPVDAPPPGPPPWDLPQAFAVVTAWNPESKSCSRAENDAANARLHADLLAHGAAVGAIVGRSADSRWEEQSFAAWNISTEHVARIAAAYGQHAIFAVDGGRRTLVSARSRVDPERGVWLLVRERSPTGSSSAS